MTIKTQILNGTITQIIQPTDPISAIWLPIGLIAVTSLVAIISFWYNRRTHQILKTELESKIKPNLLVKDYHWYRNDNKIGVSSAIENLGTVPARNTIVYNYIKSQEPSLRELISNENKNEKIKSNVFRLDTVLPNFTINYISSKTADENSGEWYLATWIEYDYLNNKHEEVIHVFKFRTDTRTVYAYGQPPTVRLIRSYDEFTIKRERKEWNSLMSGKGGASF